MIISFKHNFIFIKTRKTASTTIEKVLQATLAPNDLYVSDDMLRRVAEDSFELVPLVEAAGHMKAEEIVDLVQKSFWDASYKFTSERHPYEKVVSFAYYNFARHNQKGKPIQSDFPEYMDQVVRRGKYRSFNYYTIDGKVIVDDFIRYERLSEDLQRIAGRLGFEIPDELPQKRSAFRLDRRPATEILSDEQKQIVFETCREEFELLGYQP